MAAGVAGTTAGVVAGVAIPNETGEEYLNHYTNAEGHAKIDLSGYIKQSVYDGNVYLTPDVYGSGADAQSALQLTNTPVGYYRVPFSDANVVSGAGQVPNGTGYEVKVPHPVSIRNATWVDIGP